MLAEQLIQGIAYTNERNYIEVDNRIRGGGMTINLAKTKYIKLDQNSLVSNWGTISLIMIVREMILAGSKAVHKYKIL